MKLKCPKCGNISCIVVPKRDIQKATGMENIGVSGIVDPRTAIAIISLLQAIFAWFRDNDQKYLLCGKCGNYEVLRENS